MAIVKLVFCLASLLILTVCTASPMPQGFVNFGWPTVQPEFVPRLTPTAFNPGNVVVNPMPRMTASVSSMTTTGQQTQRRLPKEPAITRVQNGPTPRLSLQHAKVNESTTPVVSEEIVLSELNKTTVTKEANTETPAISQTGLEIPTANSMAVADASKLVPAGIAVLGAAMGNDGCYLKAACLAGSLVPAIQGREMFVAAAETLVPAEWKSVFQAAKASIIQGERADCSHLSCF